MKRCAAGHRSVGSSRSFPAIVPFGAAENLRQQLLRVLRLHPEATPDLHDAQPFEVAHLQDLLIAGPQAFQRLAGRELVGETVQDARGRRVRPLEGLVVVERLDGAPILPPVVPAGGTDGAAAPRRGVSEPLLVWPENGK